MATEDKDEGWLDWANRVFGSDGKSSEKPSEPKAKKEAVNEDPEGYARVMTRTTPKRIADACAEHGWQKAPITILAIAVCSFCACNAMTVRVDNSAGEYDSIKLCGLCLLQLGGEFATVGDR